MVKVYKRVQLICEDPSLTRQEFKDECDLGMIIRRFCKTHEGREALKNARGFADARFEDVTNVPDYRAAQDLVIRADKVFNDLPAALRRRFNNDAAEYLDFVDNPANLDELRSMGLLKPVPKTAEVPVSVPV